MILTSPLSEVLDSNDSHLMKISRYNIIRELGEPRQKVRDLTTRDETWDLITANHLPQIHAD